MDAINTALSGLRAAEKRLEVSADNIANVNTEGAKAKEVGARTGDQGGVIVDIRVKDPATVTVPSLDGQGTTELPNTSLDQEVVNQVQAGVEVKANLRVITTQKNLDQALLDIQA